MKGIVFTEFMEMVEANWNIDMVDDLIDAVNPKSGGSYTSVATYDYEELVAYVVELNKRSGIEVDELVYTFGKYLASSFAVKFPDFFREAQCTFELLKKVDNHIHVEVRKLYPDAELPKFSYEEINGAELILHYESTRNLPDLAHGLIEGSAEFFNESLLIERSNHSDGDIVRVDFRITKNKR